MKTIFTQEHVKVYVPKGADTVRTQHAMHKLLKKIDDNNHAASLVHEFETQGSNTDEREDWILAATDVLQDHTLDGFFWVWREGELSLKERA